MKSQELPDINSKKKMKEKIRNNKTQEKNNMKNMDSRICNSFCAEKKMHFK